MDFRVKFSRFEKKGLHGALFQKKVETFGKVKENKKLLLFFILLNFIVPNQ